jgi:hypothetical protein
MEYKLCKVPRKYPLSTYCAATNQDRWFVQFKVTAFEGKGPGQGQLNPANGQTLFTPEIKVAIKEAKKKAQFIVNVLSLKKSTSHLRPPLELNTACHRTAV